MAGVFDYNKPAMAPNGVNKLMAPLAPPSWTRVEYYISEGTYTYTVPDNVWQIYAMVFGGGGAGTNSGPGGGGGGFASGLIDVIPGQTLPKITIGAAASVNSSTGGTCSIGSLLTATGAAYQNRGSGSFAGVRNGVAYLGGYGGNGGGVAGSGGGGSGSPYGNGGDGANVAGSGGGGWGGSSGAAQGSGGGGLFSSKAESPSGGGGSAAVSTSIRNGGLGLAAGCGQRSDTADVSLVGNASGATLLDIANKTLSGAGSGAASFTTGNASTGGPGGGGGGASGAGAGGGNGGIGGGGGGAANSGVGGHGGFGGGGGGSSGGNGGNGGHGGGGGGGGSGCSRGDTLTGAVLLFYTPGY